MVYIRVIKNACSNCGGTMRYYDDKLICTQCYRVEGIPTNLPLKKRNLLLSRVEEVDGMVLSKMSRAGSFLLQLPDFVQAISLLKSYNEGVKLSDEEEAFLKKCGLLKELGGIEEDES